MFEDGFLVRCNVCMAEFEEDEIPLDKNFDEYCPYCGSYGFLMDLD